MGKPFSQACENNKRPILEVLQRRLGDVSSVLEIGSGTGQHAVYMGKHLPHVSWLTSDRPENHEGFSFITMFPQLFNKLSFATFRD